MNNLLLRFDILAFALYLLSMCCIDVHGQDVPQVIPPGPQTRELNKYIDFPVDHSTGIPEISIPLYTIRTNGIEIPISLNYHASGIKYAQEDGEVGLGWTLSCNYRISRTIYGHPDNGDIEMSPALYQSQMQYYADNLHFTGGFPGITVADRHLLYPYLDRDKFLRRFFHPNDYEMTMPFLTEPVLDGEYDHFYYSVPQGGGKFIISNRNNKTIHEINPSTNKFTYLEGMASNNSYSSGIIGFTIKDERQNVYSFGEQIDKLGDRVLETNMAAMDLTNVTGWALTDIDTKYGEKIKFVYKNKSGGLKIKDRVNINIIEPPYGVDQGYYWQHQLDVIPQAENYSMFALSTIKTPNERIEFEDESDSPTGDKIRRIKVVDSISNAVIKRIDLYFHEESYLAPYVFLDSIKIFDQDLTTYEKYSFGYYNEEFYGTNGINGDLVPDQWGYLKIASSNLRLLHTELGEDHALPHGSPLQSLRTNKLKQIYPGYLDNRRQNSRPELFSLRSVSYPTGGKTVYEYESNISSSSQYLGGIRIKTISHYDGKRNPSGSDILSLQRHYGYDAGGYQLYDLNHHDFRREYPVYSSGNSQRGVSYASSSFGDYTDAQSRVYYRRVTETLSSFSQGILGRNIYQYNMLSPSQQYPYHVEIDDGTGIMEYYQSGPRYVSTYSDWQKPMLTKKSVYSKDDELLNTEEYTYGHYMTNTFTGLKVRRFARVNDFSEYFPYYYGSTASIFSHGLYNIQTGKSLPLTKTEKLYMEGDSLVTITSYAYNSLDQITKETMTDSRGDLVETTRVYPTDIPSEHPYMRMLQENDVGKVLEQTVKRNDVIVEQVKNNYIEKPGNLFVPNTTTVLNVDTGLPEEGILFHLYDSKGNVQSLSKANDVTINYLWSYTKQFPVAEIKGPDYPAIETLLGGSSVIDNFSNLSNPSKTQIDSFLAPVRAAIAAGTLQAVEINSFSYDPLLGIKSQTDSRGKTVCYEYDGFGRMHLIRNDDGVIEQKVDYNYRNH